MTDEINTAGGSYIQGDVNTGRDFIGRDKITIHLTYPTAPFRPDDLDLRQTRTRYLQTLQEHTTRLDFKGLRLIETIEKGCSKWIWGIISEGKDQPLLRCVDAYSR